jgi:hypothetical protein
MAIIGGLAGLEVHVALRGGQGEYAATLLVAGSADSDEQWDKAGLGGSLCGAHGTGARCRPTVVRPLLIVPRHRD